MPVARALLAALLIVIVVVGAAPRAHAREPTLRLPGSWYRITEPYRYEEAHRFRAGWNRGADVAATGGVVRAPRAGVVRFVGVVAGRRVVTLATSIAGQPVVVTFTGLEAIDVEEGRHLEPGSVVGRGRELQVGVYDAARRTRYFPVRGDVPAMAGAAGSEWDFGLERGRSPVADVVAKRLLEAVQGHVGPVSAAAGGRPRGGSLSASGPSPARRLASAVEAAARLVSASRLGMGGHVGAAVARAGVSADAASAGAVRDGSRGVGDVATLGSEGVPLPPVSRSDWGVRWCDIHSHGPCGRRHVERGELRSAGSDDGATDTGALSEGRVPFPTDDRGSSAAAGEPAVMPAAAPGLLPAGASTAARSPDHGPHVSRAGAASADLDVGASEMPHASGPPAESAAQSRVEGSPVAPRTPGSGPWPLGALAAVVVVLMVLAGGARRGRARATLPGLPLHEPLPVLLPHLRPYAYPVIRADGASVLADVALAWPDDDPGTSPGIEPATRASERASEHA